MMSLPQKHELQRRSLGTQGNRNINITQAYDKQNPNFVAQIISTGMSRGTKTLAGEKTSWKYGEGKKTERKTRLYCREKKLMESFPGRELAERRFGAMTEESNSSLTPILFRKTGSYKLFLNGEACIIRIFYFLLRKEKKKTPVWLK